jgi:NADPH:quinone reductase-like Zn-dependent oxidoreductase
MRKISQSSFGGPEVLRLVDAERPEPAPTEVLVRVYAAGVNPVDWKTRAGRGYVTDPPLTVGWDVSGVVEAAGPGVTRFRVGEEVFGMPWFPREAGAYAEFVTAPSRHFAVKPPGLSHPQAAALPLAGLTAWQVLVDTADVRPGQRVLVAAAAGGVGHLAVQIAKARGAYVIGTARAVNHGFVRGLGADEVLDYSTVDVGAAVSDVDVAFCLAGGLELADTLRPGGLLVYPSSDLPAAFADAAAARGAGATAFLVEPDHAGLAALAELAGSGRLRVHLSDVLDLAEAAQAHRLSESGRTVGKIVLTV